VPKLPIVSGGKLIKYLCKSKGFVMGRTKGSHVILKSLDGKKTVVVPLHNELDRGTLTSILERAGLSVDEFIEEFTG
jgi:predicted RNA binding protein YcfA (HicA-like mRNA interferase family)